MKPNLTPMEHSPPILLLVDWSLRFEVAIGVMAVAVLWLVWLRVRRWWEHA